MIEKSNRSNEIGIAFQNERSRKKSVHSHNSHGRYEREANESFLKQGKLSALRLSLSSNRGLGETERTKEDSEKKS